MTHLSSFYGTFPEKGYTKTFEGDKVRLWKDIEQTGVFHDCFEMVCLSFPDQSHNEQNNKESNPRAKVKDLYAPSGRAVRKEFVSLVMKECANNNKDITNEPNPIL